MNANAVAKVRDEFVKLVPGFQGFDNPPKVLVEEELGYKRRKRKGQASFNWWMWE